MVSSRSIPDTKTELSKSSSKRAHSYVVQQGSTLRSKTINDTCEKTKGTWDLRQRDSQHEQVNLLPEKLMQAFLVQPTIPRAGEAAVRIPSTRYDEPIVAARLGGGSWRCRVCENIHPQGFRHSCNCITMVSAKLSRSFTQSRGEIQSNSHCSLCFSGISCVRIMSRGCADAGKHGGAQPLFLISSARRHVAAVLERFEPTTPRRAFALSGRIGRIRQIGGGTDRSSISREPLTFLRA